MKVIALKLEDIVVKNKKLWWLMISMDMATSELL